MSKPKLTEFLLKLATNRTFYQFYEGLNHDERKLLLESFGVSEPVATAVVDVDDPTIVAAIEAELAGNATHGGNHYTVQITLQLPACPE